MSYINFYTQQITILKRKKNVSLQLIWIIIISSRDREFFSLHNLRDLFSLFKGDSRKRKKKITAVFLYNVTGNWVPILINWVFSLLLFETFYFLKFMDNFLRFFCFITLLRFKKIMEIITFLAAKEFKQGVKSGCYHLKNQLFVHFLYIDNSQRKFIIGI